MLSSSKFDAPNIFTHFVLVILSSICNVNGTNGRAMEPVGCKPRDFLII